MIGPARPRLETPIGEPTAAPCPSGCGGIVFAPGWWCDDCTRCAFPTLLLDEDDEPDPDHVDFQP